MSTSEGKDSAPAVEADPTRGCLCGCGGQPKGRKSRYLQGHYSKHRSQLLQRLRVQADREAADELVRRGWLSRAAGTTEGGEALVRNGESKAAA